MYFNNTNDTNIDDELKKDRKNKKEKKPFYGLLLITGIVIIIISLS